MQRYLMAMATLLALASAGPVPSVAAERGALPLANSANDCASVSASARLQALGYQHVVTLANHCERAVSCEVWTNVDPSPRLTLRAKPGETAEAVTRAGSPSRDVQAGKACRYEG